MFELIFRVYVTKIRASGLEFCKVTEIRLTDELLRG